MIQRKQTIYLLLAFVVIVVCLCMPIGTIEPEGMGKSAVWYNLGISTEESFSVQPALFVILVLAGALGFGNIFRYNNRPQQARLCVVSVVLCVVWYGWYAYCFWAGNHDLGTPHIGFATCLPLVAIIFFMMARKGIKADEALVRASDRIR